MTITHASVQAWLDRYVEAWQTYDPASVEDLFAEDAEYRYHPWDEPRPRAAPRSSDDWLNPGGNAEAATSPAPGGPTTSRSRSTATAPSRSVSRSTSRRQPVTEDRHYWNGWTIEFDDAGRCTNFIEYYMRRKPRRARAAMTGRTTVELPIRR